MIIPQKQELEGLLDALDKALDKYKDTDDRDKQRCLKRIRERYDQAQRCYYSNFGQFYIVPKPL